MANILIVDDDKSLCKMLQHKLGYLQHNAIMAHTLFDGIESLEKTEFDVILLDVRLPDGSGLAVLPRFKASSSNPEVIIITGEGEPRGAELAIKAGAWDYIEKPISMSDLELQLARALQYRHERGAGTAVMALKRENLIGSSAPVNACLDLVAQCAATSTNVFITGETGTGKELFARVIHENSAYADQNFVVVDCAALPEQLTESMLFGHVKGAFTGADKSKDGLIKLAHGGTLFLDEVGELPLSMQKRFLRVLQERRYRPVGSSKEIESHFRLISATNRNLEKMTAEKQFRKDLLFRLRTFSIELPALKNRKNDIKALVLHYIANLCHYHGLETKGFVPEFLEVMQMHNWPGNVRELINTLEKAILSASTSPVIYPMHLPDALRLKYLESSKIKKPSTKETENTGSPHKTLILPSFDSLPNLKTYRERLLEQGETEYLRQLMREAHNDIPKACKISGLAKSRLYTLIKKYQIKRGKS